MARLSAEQIALHLGEGFLEEKLAKEARCSRAHLHRRLTEITDVFAVQSGDVR